MPCPSARAPRAAQVGSSSAACQDSACQDGAFDVAELPPSAVAAHPQLVPHLAPHDEGRVPAVIAAPARRDARHVPALHLLDWPRCVEGTGPLLIIPASKILDACRAHSQLHRVYMRRSRV